MKQRSLYLAISLSMFAGMGLIGCEVSKATTGGSTDLPPQVQSARVLIRDIYPEASYFRVKMNYTRDDERVLAWTNDSDWIYLSSKWVAWADKDITYAGCVLVHEWYHVQGYDELNAERKESECKQLI